MQNQVWQGRDFHPSNSPVSVTHSVQADGTAFYAPPREPSEPAPADAGARPMRVLNKQEFVAQLETAVTDVLFEHLPGMTQQHSFGIRRDVRYEVLALLRRRGKRVRGMSKQAFLQRLEHSRQEVLAKRKQALCELDGLILRAESLRSQRDQHHARLADLELGEWVGWLGEVQQAPARPAALEAGEWMQWLDDVQDADAKAARAEAALRPEQIRPEAQPESESGQRQEVPETPRKRVQAERPQRDQGPRQESGAGDMLSSPEASSDAAIEQRVRTMFEQSELAQRAPSELHADILAFALRAAGCQREATAASDKDREIELLERRIGKLNQSLGSMELTLVQLSKMKDVEHGEASIYRAVQGLSELDELYAAKKEMLQEIFEANVGLFAQIA